MAEATAQLLVLLGVGNVAVELVDAPATLICPRAESSLSWRQSDSPPSGMVSVNGATKCRYLDGGVCTGPFGAGFGVDGGGVVFSGSSTGNGP